MSRCFSHSLTLANMVKLSIKLDHYKFISGDDINNYKVNVEVEIDVLSFMLFIYLKIRRKYLQKLYLNANA